jgi:hypothetical protein
MLCFTSYYIFSQPVHNPMQGVDEYIFFTGAEAVRQNQSPYTSAIASGLNLGFVPIYVLCGAMGDSFEAFHRSFVWIDLGSILAGVILAVTGLIIFFVKANLPKVKILEIILEALTLGMLFSFFLAWNRSFGNFSSLLALLVILIMVFHYFDRPIITGLLLGAAVSVKPYFFALGAGYFIHLVLKKDARSFKVLSGAAFFLIATVLVLHLFEGGLGFNTYLEFLTVVSRQHIPGMLNNVNNVSIHSILSIFMKNWGMGYDPRIASGITLAMALLAFGAGAFLCKKSPSRNMPISHVVYYLLLTTVIYPLLWEHYFSWLAGPAFYFLARLNLDADHEHLIPALVLSCGIMVIWPVAWMGGLALLLLYFLAEVESYDKAQKLNLPVEEAFAKPMS